ncbi:MAG: protocatechuate 3,4-dioxygenase subunit alpha, partial [Streptosporangiaceae bacterium]|nr:protocatechuate 3,4-dioxygenase subunit alpha [Streptosporangiaceae bacterium]
MGARLQLGHRPARPRRDGLRVTGLTPSQTVGPYFAMRLPWPDGPYVVPEGTPGAVVIVGRVYDGAGNTIPDALIETWQADPDGRFAHPHDPRGASPSGYREFRGFGRCETSPDGSYRIVTLKPGPLPTPEGDIEAPHLDVSVFARGLLDRVVTRMYFPGDPLLPLDPIFNSVPDEKARQRLIAAFDIELTQPEWALGYN